MNYQSESPHLQALFEAALRDYQGQTGIALDKHPLAEQLRTCDSVESVTAVFREQAPDEFQGNDKILKLLKKVVSTLYRLSAADIGPVRP